MPNHSNRSFVGVDEVLQNRFEIYTSHPKAIPIPTLIISLLIVFHCVKLPFVVKETLSISVHNHYCSEKNRLSKNRLVTCREKIIQPFSQMLWEWPEYLAEMSDNFFSIF